MRSPIAKCGCCKVDFPSVPAFDKHLPCAASAASAEPYAAGMAPQPAALALNLPSAGRVSVPVRSASRSAPVRKTRPRLPNIGVALDFTD